MYRRSTYASYPLLSMDGPARQGWMDDGLVICMDGAEG